MWRDFSAHVLNKAGNMGSDLNSMKFSVCSITIIVAKALKCSMGTEFSVKSSLILEVLLLFWLLQLLPLLVLLLLLSMSYVSRICNPYLITCKKLSCVLLRIPKEDCLFIYLFIFCSN